MKQAVTTETHQLIQGLCMLHTYSIRTQLHVYRSSQPNLAQHCARTFCQTPWPIAPTPPCALQWFDWGPLQLSHSLHTNTEGTYVCTAHAPHYSEWNRNSQTKMRIQRGNSESMLLVETRKFHTDSRDLGPSRGACSNNSQMLKSELV